MTLITDDNIQLHLLAMDAADEIAVDTETSGLDVRNKRDYCMGIAYSVDGFSGYFPFRHPDSNLDKRYLDSLVSILRKKPLIWHNQKFDFHSLATLGIDPLSFTGQQYCTLIIASLVNEELWSKELDALSKIFLKEEKDDKDFYAWGKALGFANIPAHMAAKRIDDPIKTRRLFHKLWPMAVEQGLDKVYLETEEPFTRLLYLMEQRAVGTNLPFCEEKVDFGTKRMSTIKRQFRFNPASPKELGKYLIDDLGLPVVKHTKSCDACQAGESVETHEGRASFDKHAMEDYDLLLEVTNNQDAKTITEFRGWQKSVSSLYLPVLEKVDAHGHIRTEFKQHGTVTGRLSASNPNLQQVPRHTTKPWNGDAKQSFTSGRDEEYALYGWDYSQLELRIAAAYGNETSLIEEFKKPDSDVFSLLAPQIFGTLTPDTRHYTKNGFVYPNLYGAGLKKIAYTINRPIEETRDLYENYKNSIPGIIGVSNRVTKLVQERGWVQYWDGRRRHIRDRRKAYKAWNSVCQGGAAQLVKKAMLRIQEFEDENCFQTLQVHDEVVFCIKRSMISHYEPLIVNAMTDWPIFNVTLAVSGKEWQ